MDYGLFVLLLIAYAYIGILPRIFFRSDGSYNLMWWLTSSPLFLSGFYIFSAKYDLIPALAPWNASIGMGIPSALLAAFSIGFISMTLGTHRVPLSLWHQKNDAPVHIVTWGAYKYVRHPFYSSFIVAQIAALLAAPHWITVAGLIGTLAVLTTTAQKEEAKLGESQFGAEYKSYMAKTGRFFPRIGA